MLNQRNPDLHITVLSGDIGDTSYISDNSYHVVRISGTRDIVTLDGINICFGNANGPHVIYGAGLLTDATNTNIVEVINCHFHKGHATEENAIYNLGKLSISGSTLTNLPGSLQAGSVIYNAGSSANLHITDTLIIQSCTQCGEIVRNVGGAELKVSYTVTLERQ